MSYKTSLKTLHRINSIYLPSTQAISFQEVSTNVTLSLPRFTCRLQYYQFNGKDRTCGLICRIQMPSNSMLLT